VKPFFLTLFLLCAAPAYAQYPVIGYWQTANNGGVIQVKLCGELLCARLAGIVLDHPNDKMPTDWRGVSQCGLTLIQGAHRTSIDKWRGKIVDPRNGHIYGVELHVDNRGLLALRGFLGVALLGRTDYWHRYNGVPPEDCRLAPGGRPW
jgi:uncharacterized protein (DUF2147 family)